MEASKKKADRELKPDKVLRHKNRGVDMSDKQVNELRSIDSLLNMNLSLLVSKKEWFSKFITEVTRLLTHPSEGLNDPDVYFQYLKIKGLSVLYNFMLKWLPNTSFSYDKATHDATGNFYVMFTWTDPGGDIFESRMDYVSNSLRSERSKFIPEDWLEEMDPDHSDEFELEGEFEKVYVSKKLNALSSFQALDHTTLQIETLWYQECLKMQKQVSLGEVTASLFSDLPLYKLTSTFPELPGIYAIYYLGDKALYGESTPASLTTPVYIGMSTTDIGKSRLQSHCRKIKQSEDLLVTDFGVSIMVLDIPHFAPCLEGLLIEHYKPIWNRETVGLSFGNATEKTNLWNIYHIQQIPTTKIHINTILSLECYNSSSGSDSH